MSDRDDVDREIAEEDELSALLRTSDRSLVVPPFSALARRAEPRHVAPGRALASAAVLVLALIAGIGAWRASTPAASPTGSVPPTASPAATPCGSGALRFATLVGPRTSGQWLRTSLESIRPIPESNQLHWFVRFALPRESPGPTTVSMRAGITAGTQHSLHVLGYEMLEPDRRAIVDGEVLTVGPCDSMVLSIRTAGPLIEGTFPYAVTIEKVSLPEGGTVSERFDLGLTCSNRTFTCTPADAAGSPAPTATPVAGVLKSDFGIIYDGIRQGWEKGSAPLVRREGETRTAVGELAPSYFNRPNVAIAPDGRRAVYFAQRRDEPWTLFLLDGARPNEQRVLATIPKEIPGGRLVWSGDGNGVAFAVLDEGANQGVTPKYSAVRTLDISSRAVTEVARVEGGSHYELVGWDRANGRLAAMIVPRGETPRTYIVLSGSGKREWTLDGAYSAVAAPNGREVAAVRCQATIGCSFWTWKLEDFDSRVDQNFGSGLSMGVIGWRPGTGDVGIFVTDILAGAGGRIELWSAAAGRRIVFGPGERVSGDAFFRADGSALIVPLALDEAVAVDLATGRNSPLPLPTPQEPWEIGRPTASIRLG